MISTYIYIYTYTLILKWMGVEAGDLCRMLEAGGQKERK